MRPVLLEMEGFASYRQRATVDFRDADFFVLVGATGSGKSTVIDAMIFALYGTVPRWGERNAVAPALAPTVNRGTVRLIFDAGGQRYVAARDVRRSKSGGVTVKEARLERFVESDAEGTVDDETTPMAVGRDVSPAVSELLGLTFEQFTKSVALPQGEFAQFLHATGSERQAILKSLLGYRIYDEIMRKAGAQATNDESRVKVFEEQLAGYADATTESVDHAQTALNGLLILQKHVADVAIPALLVSLQQAQDARANADKLAAERMALLALEMPSNIAELDAETASRTEAVASARAEVARIEELDTIARATLKQATPRHELEQVIASWQTLTRLEAELPQLRTQASVAAADLETATAALLAADAEVEHAREVASESDRVAETSMRRRDEITSRLVAVESLRPPEGLDNLGARLRQADVHLAEARSAMDKAETAQVNAAATLKASPNAATIADIASALDNIRAGLADDLDSAAARQEETVKAANARKEVSRAEEAVRDAERAVHDAQHFDLATTLRAGLKVGDDCPVCGRTVKKELSAGDSIHLDDAREKLQQAREAHQFAERAASALETACRRSATLREERLARCETERLRLIDSVATVDIELGALSASINDHSDIEHLESARGRAESVLIVVRDKQRERDGLEERRRTADTEVEAARSTLRKAEASAKAAHAGADHARNALQTARDSVSSLSPPKIEDVDIESAWSALLEWAAEQVSELQVQSALLETAAKEARDSATSKKAALAAAEAKAVGARNAAIEATARKTEADTRLDNAVTQQARLAGELTDAPDAAQAQQLLTDVIAKQTNVDQLATELTTARDVLEKATNALEANTTALSASWQQLRTLRDPLASFGAPPLDDLPLTDAWTLMVEWAQAEAAARAAKIDAENAAAEQADLRAADAQAALIAALNERNVAVAEDTSGAELVTTAPVTVATAVATATAERDRAQERVNESSELRAKLDTAREDAAVARRLAQLMHANQFQQWLIASALDTLLAEASTILMEISGNQFELRRKEGDLEVIDHNDADMSRPVKTLSGGETFQASLALALALSSQVTALSAAGGKTLESILLDEGFGTLDDNTLDVVASTLENLAAAGSRLVGVITHVVGLAERIPVRFSVHRDTLGSHIRREAV
ncbi:hypothetical protein A5752_02085 [Mycobacterium sp. 852002-51961_SCH5331710]|nr:hypothetical protein A5752_02085 [Mycobacterium sp. 852002-51961_SCH5331710]